MTARKPRPVTFSAVPEVSPEERVATPEPTAEEKQASLDAEKCGTCKGLGLVRKAGPKAGKHYRTLDGAQAALEHGNAVDCPKCNATGLVAGL